MSNGNPPNGTALQQDGEEAEGNEKDVEPLLKRWRHLCTHTLPALSARKQAALLSLQRINKVHLKIDQRFGVGTVGVSSSVGGTAPGGFTTKSASKLAQIYTDAMNDIAAEQVAIRQALAGIVALREALVTVEASTLSTATMSVGTVNKKRKESTPVTILDQSAVESGTQGDGVILPSPSESLEPVVTESKPVVQPPPPNASTLKKAKIDETQTLATVTSTAPNASPLFSPGDEVAIKPSGNVYITAFIVRYLPERQQKYEVEDAEDDELKPGTRK